MSDTSTKKPLYDRIALSCFVIFVTILVTRTWSTPDIWTHLTRANSSLSKVSLSYIFQQPEAGFYTLFRLGIHYLYEVGGIYAVQLSFTGLWLLTFYALYQLVGCNRIQGLAYLTVFALLAEHRYKPRPDVLSFLFIALFIACFSRWEELKYRRWISVGILLVQCLWVNCHGYFFLGVGFAWLAWAIHRRRDLLFLAASMTVICQVNPLGFGIWGSVIKHSSILRELSPHIREFQSPFAGPFNWHGILFFAACLAVGILNIVTLRRLGWQNLLSVIGLVVSLTSLRMAPLLLIFSAPLYGVWQASNKDWTRPSFRLCFVGLLVLLTLALVRGTYHRSLKADDRPGIGLATMAYPEMITEQISAFEGRLFNTARSGGYLSFHHPGIKISGDSQFSDVAISLSFFYSYHPEGFEALTSATEINGAILHIESNFNLIDSLLDKRWRVSGGDLGYALMTPPDALTPVIIDPPRMFSGVDIAKPRYRSAAVRWSLILSKSNRGEALAALLRYFANSPIVPAPVIYYARDYLMRSGDKKVLQSVLPLVKKVDVWSDEEKEYVSRMLQQVVVRTQD